MLFAELPACWTSLLIWVKLSWSQLGSLTCIVVDLQWTGPRSSQMRHLICGPSFFILILQQAKPGFFMWQYLGSCQLGYEIAYHGFFHILLARKEELRPRWKLLQNHALCREWWRVGIIFAISVYFPFASVCGQSGVNAAYKLDPWIRKPDSRKSDRMKDMDRNFYTRLICYLHGQWLIQMRGSLDRTVRIYSAYSKWITWGWPFSSINEKAQNPRGAKGSESRQE